MSLTPQKRTRSPSAQGEQPEPKRVRLEKDAEPEKEPVQCTKEMPHINSEQSLVKKHLTPEIYAQLSGHRTATAGVTLDDCIICAVQLNNQQNGFYAGDGDCYIDYAPLVENIINDLHAYGPDKTHQSNMNVDDLEGNINPKVPVVSTRIRVGRNIEGYGLSPGITREQRQEVENLLKEALGRLEGDLAGTYYPLTGMEESVRVQLIQDHFLFKSGDPNLQVSGMEREWPEARGIFHNAEKTFLVWVNEEDQMRIISMQQGGDVRAVFERLSRGVRAIEESLAASGKRFQFSDRFGFIHSCPSNLGTGMRASVHVDLPNWAKDHEALKARCKELALQPRGAHGESSGETGIRYDISNKRRLGYTEVELVQTMINGVNTLFAEDAARGS